MTDDELRDHRKQLEAAINEALADSPQVGAIIHDIRERGYDVFLIIEATVGFSRRHDSDEEPHQVSATKLELTSQDECFLRDLRISPE
jgi:hypothetical protein